MKQTDVDEILDGYEVVETSHLYHHEHDKEKLMAKINRLIVEARIDELEYIKSQNVAIPCEPDCTELRHARHEGAWEQHLEFDGDIDKRIKELTSGGKR